jgi:hypothetical protein
MIKAIEPLGKHDRAAFSCGVVALDEWFRFRAGRVFVAIDDRRRIVGFYSLSSFTLAIADLPAGHAKRLPRHDAIPAALIGRLTRDEKVRGEGLGELADAVRRVIGGSRSLAVVAIVVEATAVAFSAQVLATGRARHHLGKEDQRLIIEPAPLAGIVILILDRLNRRNRSATKCSMSA